MAMEDPDDPDRLETCDRPATRSMTVELHDRPGCTIRLRLCDDCYRMMERSRR